MASAADQLVDPQSQPSNVNNQPEIKDSKMSRGGKRINAGRPKGSRDKRKESVLLRAVEEGLSPIDVMLRAMREAVAKDQMHEAAKFAQMAAPYIHPRLQAIQHTGREGGPIEVADMSRNDLARRILHMLRSGSEAK